MTAATGQPAEALTTTATSLLRFATAGSVDDGKSTLAGRLLHDSRSVLSDQLAAVEHASRARGLSVPDLALLTDGLRAEREQGITIDVAYRYFATPRRRFVLADTPGHVQYTRNMVTGASTAELMVILTDVRHGVVEQTRRHTAVAALLRVPHLLLAVNKLDLVDFRAAPFTAVVDDFTALAKSLGVPEVTAIPISARDGDNVVTASTRMDWYGGPTLLDHLETVPAAGEPDDTPARFPVQYVIRPGATGQRGYAGRITAGTLRVGDRVTVLPAGLTSTVTAIDALGTPVDSARAPQSVSLRLADDLDVARGDLIAPVDAAPRPTRTVEATVCHLHDRPLREGARVLVKHATRTVPALVTAIPVRLDPDGLRPSPAHGSLSVNDLGRVTLRTAEPLPLDPYARSRRNGSFLLIDPADGSTLTAGMVGQAPGTAGESHEANGQSR
ncbi:sulfate adenylyltransferase subunit 1 [Kitasatospora sp. NPDC058406]|uniref:sulfate adenylyltransferase subunit 1 n=1 Tax=Kitasatospora sp. NPDC058406 TaxID=3346483 RepID=UPI0036464CCE